MKLALVHLRHAGTGGTERYMNLCAAHLARAGHDVTIVCRSHEDPPHAAIRFVVLRSPTLGSAWRMWAFARDVERHVVQSDYDVVYALGRTWTHDVIRLGGGSHATFLERARRVAGSGRRWRDTPLYPKHWTTLHIERRALSPGAYCRVITNSRMVARDVSRRHDIPPESIDVIYNGVDPSRFRPELRETLGMAIRREAGLSPDDFVLLFLGSGYGRKGLDRVLAALPTVLRERPDLHLLVVGYDPRPDWWREAVRRAGLADRVRMLGGRRDAEACYAAADLYVLPTLYDPFANSTLEALASGLPVVTTDANGGSELIEPGVHGSVLRGEYEDVELADALLEWTASGRAHGARAAARALGASHDAESMAVATTAVLERAADSSPCSWRRKSSSTKRFQSR